MRTPPKRAASNAAKSMDMTPNPQCPVCHGFGGTLATVDDVKADTPKEVVQAVQDAAPWPAFIKCPEFDGSGLLYR